MGEQFSGSLGKAKKLGGKLGPPPGPVGLRGAGGFRPPGEDIFYIAVAHQNSPYIQVIKWDGENLTKVAEYPVFGVHGRFLQWSPDGNYLAVVGFASTTVDELVVLNWDKKDETLTFVDSYALEGYQVSWHPGGNLIAVASSEVPWLALFNFDGSSLTVQPTGLGGDVEAGQGVAWNPTNGSWLAYGRYKGTADFETTLYEWTGSQLIERDHYDHVGRPFVTYWSPNGDYVCQHRVYGVVVFSFSPNQLTYKDIWSAGGNTYGGDWSPDNIYLSVGHLNSPNFTILKFDGSDLTVAASYDLGGFGLNGGFSPDGGLVVSACYYSPQLRLFSWDGVSTLQELASYDAGGAVWAVDFLMVPGRPAAYLGDVKGSLGQPPVIQGELP